MGHGPLKPVCNQPIPCTPQAQCKTCSATNLNASNNTQPFTDNQPVPPSPTQENVNAAGSYSTLMGYSNRPYGGSFTNLYNRQSESQTAINPVGSYSTLVAYGSPYANDGMNPTGSSTNLNASGSYTDVMGYSNRPYAGPSLVEFFKQSDDTSPVASSSQSNVNVQASSSQNNVDAQPSQNNVQASESNINTAGSYSNLMGYSNRPYAQYSVQNFLNPKDGGANMEYSIPYNYGMEYTTSNTDNNQNAVGSYSNLMGYSNRPYVQYSSPNVQAQLSQDELPPPAMSHAVLSSGTQMFCNDPRETNISPSFVNQPPPIPMRMKTNVNPIQTYSGMIGQKRSQQSMDNNNIDTSGSFTENLSQAFLPPNISQERHSTKPNTSTNPGNTPNN